jgi:hypothetical protein
MRRILVLALAWVAFAIVPATSAQTGGGYSLGGTIGQADAGVLTGGGYTLSGGFWAGAAIDYRTYLPLTLRQ